MGTIEKIPSTEHILFLDIETVSQYPEYEKTPERMKLLWDKKAEILRNIYVRNNPASNEVGITDDLYERAGIYAEFGKIVCISVGFSLKKDEIRIKSFYGDDEKVLLQDFAQLLKTYYSKPNSYLCAHNGKEFDFPYIARRMLINEIELPSILNLAGRKPWENRHIDTLELWKFGDYKHYTSLDLLAAVFEIPTPKDEIDGSMVNDIYWKENDLEKIVHYCEKDVKTVFLLYSKMQDLIK